MIAATGGDASANLRAASVPRRRGWGKKPSWADRQHGGVAFGLAHRHGQRRRSATCGRWLRSKKRTFWAETTVTPNRLLPATVPPVLVESPERRKDGAGEEKAAAAKEGLGDCAVALDPVPQAQPNGHASQQHDQRRARERRLRLLAAHGLRPFRPGTSIRGIRRACSGKPVMIGSRRGRATLASLRPTPARSRRWPGPHRRGRSSRRPGLPAGAARRRAPLSS